MVVSVPQTSKRSNLSSFPFMLVYLEKSFQSSEAVTAVVFRIILVITECLTNRLGKESGIWASDPWHIANELHVGALKLLAGVQWQVVK